MSDIKEALANGSVWVKFTKKDGSERVGTFTTSSKLIPATKQPSGTGTPRKVSDSNTRVFDLEKQEWRSFSNDSVIEWTVV